MQAILAIPFMGHKRPVGKVFPIRTSAGARNVFLHDEARAVSAAESPCGIDWCVVKRLLDWKIETIFHKQPKQDQVLMTTTTLLIDFGVRTVDQGRRRTFLAWEHWQEYQGKPLAVPWIKETATLNPNDDYLPGSEMAPVILPDRPQSASRRTPRPDAGDEAYRHQPTGLQAWQPLPAHLCLACGRLTAQSDTCVICRGEAWTAAREATIN